jgi:UDP-perosamine 4-acetyltransferase
MPLVLGLGAGGHAKVVIEILRAGSSAELVGLLDPRPDLWGTEVLGVPVLGGDELLPSQYDAGVTHVFIGLGGADRTDHRRRLYEKAVAAGFSPVAAVHPSAVVSSSALIGSGPTIGATAVVNADARLGDDVIVNTGAIVEHDCVLGDHVHVASGARLASGVVVSDGAHVGLGASVRQGITIGPEAVVGAGAVVVRDVPAGTVVAGVPARELRSRGDDG